MTGAQGPKKGGRASARPVSGAEGQAPIVAVPVNDPAGNLLGWMIAGVFSPAAAVAVPLPEPVESREDEAAEISAIRAQERIERERSEEFERAFADLLGDIFPERDKPILDWMVRGLGKPVGLICKEILRSAIAKERPAYREAMGGGGSSSRDIGGLSERLPPRT